VTTGGRCAEWNSVSRRGKVEETGRKQDRGALQWAGYVAHKEDVRMTSTTLVWKRADKKTL